MNRNFIAFTCVGALLLAGTAAQSQQNPPMNPPMMMGAMDKDFVTQASQGNLAEIKAADLALMRSRDVNVRRLAHMVMEHHMMSQEQLRGTAMSMNSMLPEQMDTMMSEDYDKLEKLSGTGFDHAYIKQQIEAHKKAIWMFQRYQQETTDPHMRIWATGTTPTLKRHLMEFKYLWNKCITPH